MNMQLITSHLTRSLINNIAKNHSVTIFDIQNRLNVIQIQNNTDRYSVGTSHGMMANVSLENENSWASKYILPSYYLG